jgi:hypothetical protein
MSDGPITDAPKPSDEQDQPAPERPDDEGESTPVEDAPEGS